MLTTKFSGAGWIFLCKTPIKMKDHFYLSLDIYRLYHLAEFIRSYVIFLSEDFSVMADIFREKGIKSAKRRKPFTCR